MSGIYNWVTSSASTSGNAAAASEPEEDAATPDGAAATPEDAATAPGDVAHPRQSRPDARNNYNLRGRPQDSRGVTPQERLRQRLAARSPSPSPTASTTFTFPPAAMDADAIRALVQETLRASTAAAVQASVSTVGAMIPEAVRDTMRDQVRDVSALTRKPDLPAFDATNIEIWIRRIENAFTRAAILNVKDKLIRVKKNVVLLK